MTAITKIPAINSAAELKDRFSQLGFDIPVAEKQITAKPIVKASKDSMNTYPCLASTVQFGTRTIGNRFSRR